MNMIPTDASGIPHYWKKSLKMDNRILILAAALLGVSLGIFFLLTIFIRNFLRARKKVFIYAILFMLAFALIALLGYKDLIPDPNVLLLVFQVFFLLMGIVHSRTLYHYFDWSSQRSFLPELIFSLFIWFLGLIPFLTIYSALNDSGYQYLMLAASVFFIIPMFFVKAFESALSIPGPEMRRWFYPVHDRIPEPDTDELRKPRVISFVLPKKTDDQKLIDFRAKAPEEMPVGRLFYHFMEDYNQKHRDQLIDFADKFGRPYGWLFYFKPRWYLFYSKYYIDPNLSVMDNKIRENSVIVCERADLSTEVYPAVLEK